MSSATARFFSLLPIRHPRPFFSTARIFISLPPPPLSTPRRFHFRPHLRSYYGPQHIDSGRDSSPWPEWSNLISSFNFPPYSDRVQEDFGEFVDGGRELPADFARAASACLAFARDHEHRLWSLPREDIEGVVQNGLPFLFKDAEDTVRRMKQFLNGSTSHVTGSDKPSTVDLMKFLLSYASTALASSGSNSSTHSGTVEASVRRLFSELAVVSGSSEPANFGSRPKQLPETNGQFPESSAQVLQMKRGDWVCPRCRFMNFARNMKCLECEESRPKRQLSGGEWECPQCDFFNYGRNTVCLRCDCKKPGMINPVAGSGYDNYQNNGSSEKRFTENLENPQNWFSKISRLENESSESDAYASSTAMDDRENHQDERSQRWSKGVSQPHDTKDHPSGISHKGFPEPMPIPRGENQVFLREKKDRSLTSPLYKRRMAMEQPASNNYVPFVPFPPDYFSKGKDTPRGESVDPSTPSAPKQPQRSAGEAGSGKAPISANTFSEDGGEAGKEAEHWRGNSLEGSAVKEVADPLDMSEEAKAERWFRRVAQIKDIKELSEIPDEDFPSIMPMRKGVNRFVVSKRKTPLERRLASSQYRRNLPVVSSEAPVKDVEDVEG